MQQIRLLLLPIAWIYWIGVRIRNLLFDSGILKGYGPDIPTICVGNLAIGGTGKTPMTAYLSSLLHANYSIAVLSRGYKRKTKGFKIVNAESTVHEVGDEPLLIKLRQPDAIVAVDEDRMNGMVELFYAYPELDAIILDDAFQHRWVKPGLNLLLTEYSNLYIHDFPLPAGRLRDSLSERKRANIIIVTKCPEDLTTDRCREISAELKPNPNQTIYFTSLEYGMPQPVFSESAGKLQLTDTQPVFALAGIANPKPFVEYLRSQTALLATKTFADHHYYSEKEIKDIFKELDRSTEQAVLVTTEKDAVRLQNLNLPEEIKKRIYYIPVSVKFLFNDSDNFNNQILSYVRENKSDSSFHQGEGYH